MAGWDFEVIEAAFVSAAMNPDLWPRTMDLVAKATESAGALLLPISGARMPGVPCSSSLAAATDTYFRDRWHEHDERNKGIPQLLSNGVLCDLDLFSHEYIRRHRYYQEFLAPHDLRWFAGVRVAFGDDVWCLSIQRKIEDGPFSDSEKGKLARLVGTLPASAALAKAMGFAASGATLQALEVSGSAALLINRRGEVFQMNRSAERMLVCDPRIINRRLTSKDAKATTAFDHALHELLWRRSGPASLKAVVLPRQDQHPLLAYPIQIPALSRNPLADCRAVVILIDLSSRKQIPEETLRAAFQLTDAESRVAARLASGYGTDDVADQLRLTTETVRTQVKVILAKTATHRQAELVALLGAFMGGGVEKARAERKCNGF